MEHNKKHSKPLLFMGLLLLWTVLTSALPVPVQGSFLYKNYVIREDMGWEILCAPYIVQRNDWVLKIFKLRGEIAQKDFPHFIRIFNRINPHIRDINRIRPGQQILIPLKRLRESPEPDNTTGIVTIPFVDLSRSPGQKRPPSDSYRVKRGDCISKLIAGQFGSLGSRTYKEALAVFKQLNPHIEDLDLIFIDQTLFLPRGLEPGKRVSATEKTDRITRKNNRQSPSTFKKQAPSKFRKESTGTPMIPPLAEAAAIMDAKLMNSGKYFFPRTGQDDLKLNLAHNPVLEMSDGSRVMLADKQGLSAQDLATVKSKWKAFTQVNVSARAPIEDILNTVLSAANKIETTPSLAFSAGGAQITIRAKWILKGAGTELNPVRNICISFIEHPDQRTPTGIIRFLEHHGIRLKEVFRGSQPSSSASPVRAMPVPPQNPIKDVMASGRRSFVSDLLNAMGYAYTQNVTITFPYAGTEIKALSNLVTTPEGKPVFVDYGDLFGDAFLTIQKTGFSIIQINHTDTPRQITAKLVGVLGSEWSRNPSFFAADRPAKFNTEFVIQGYLTEKRPDTAQMLLTFTAIDRALVNMLNERNIRIIVLPGDTG